MLADDWRDALYHETLWRVTGSDVARVLDADLVADGRLDWTARRGAGSLDSLRAVGDVLEDAVAFIVLVNWD